MDVAQLKPAYDLVTATKSMLMALGRPCGQSDICNALNNFSSLCKDYHLLPPSCQDTWATCFIEKSQKISPEHFNSVTQRARMNMLCPRCLPTNIKP